MLTPGQGSKINVMKTQGNLGIDMCLDVVRSLSHSSALSHVFLRFLLSLNIVYRDGREKAFVSTSIMGFSCALLCYLYSIAYDSHDLDLCIDTLIGSIVKL